MVLTRQQQLYTYLSGIFVAALLLGDLMGGKAFGVDVHLFGLRYQQPLSVGAFAFPITFFPPPRAWCTWWAAGGSGWCCTSSGSGPSSRSRWGSSLFRSPRPPPRSSTSS